MFAAHHRTIVAAAALPYLILTSGCSFDLEAVSPPGGTDQGSLEAGTEDAAPDGPQVDGPLVVLALRGNHSTAKISEYETAVARYGDGHIAVWMDDRLHPA